MYCNFVYILVCCFKH